MPRGARPSGCPTEDWQQLTLLIDWPYELIRPVVLFGRAAAERAQDTGAAERTLRRNAKRFDQEGMTRLLVEGISLRVEDRRLLAPHLRQLVVDFESRTPSFPPR